MKTAEEDRIRASQSQESRAVLTSERPDKSTKLNADGKIVNPKGKAKIPVKGVIVAAVVVTAGAFAFLSGKIGHGEKGHAGEAAPAAVTSGSHKPVLTVTVQNPKLQMIERQLPVHGTISTWDPISIGATTSGLEVKSILVDEGQLVKKGQLLATLDSSQLEAQLQSEKARLAASKATVTKSIQPNRPEDINGLTAAAAQAEAMVADNEAALVQARANLEDANTNIKRYQYMKREGAVSAQEAETRETTARVAEAVVHSAEQKVAAAKHALKQAQERLSMANIGGRKEDIDIANANVNEIQGNVRKLEKQIAETKIVSPVNGLITKRDVHLGDITSAGKSMFSMARDNRFELKAQVPENDLQFIHAGEPVVIQSTLSPQEGIVGSVREISPLVDSDLRLATARIDVPNNKGLKAGMYAEGTINVGKYSGLTVPSQAIISRDEKSTVFVLHKDQVEQRHVSVGNRAGDSVEIRSGISPAEQVIIDGAGFLKDADYVSLAQN